MYYKQIENALKTRKLKKKKHENRRIKDNVRNSTRRPWIPGVQLYYYI